MLNPNPAARWLFSGWSNLYLGKPNVTSRSIQNAGHENNA
jgi:hypothetical protein